MGKGVPFLESREKNHFIRVDPPEWQKALDILDAASRVLLRHQPQAVFYGSLMYLQLLHACEQ